MYSHVHHEVLIPPFHMLTHFDQSLLVHRRDALPAHKNHSTERATIEINMRLQTVRVPIPIAQKNTWSFTATRKKRTRGLPELGYSSKRRKKRRRSLQTCGIFTCTGQPKEHRFAFDQLRANRVDSKQSFFMRLWYSEWRTTRHHEIDKFMAGWQHSLTLASFS